MNKIFSLPLFTFTLALFLSAGLMFGVQPMIGKMLLPIVGGTPSGWVVAMAFFQVMLLIGYFLAYLLSRFDPRTHTLLYLAFLVLGASFLPTSLPQSVSSSSPQDIFFLLSKALALPFIAISATASTLQRLFTTTKHHSAKDPYFLYASSNLGSFFGLFLYIFFTEPLFTLTEQSQYWFYGYMSLIVFVGGCLLFSQKKPKEEKVEQHRFNWKQTSEWIVLAFIPSALLLAVTTHITTDIFSAPLIWVLPLSLYLLTFVIAFNKKPLISYKTTARLQPIAIAIAFMLFLTLTAELRVSWLSMTGHLFAFTIVSLMCHLRLASLRPLENDNQGLPAFYLIIALGGAIGGLLNAFVFPIIFDKLIEYPILLLLSTLLHPKLNASVPNRYKYILILSVITSAVYFIIQTTSFLRTTFSQDNIALILDFILLIFLLSLAFHPRAILTGSIFSCAIIFFFLSTGSIMTHRSFYGVVSVGDEQKLVGDRVYIERGMYHGVILHGFQVTDPEYKTTPTAYFSKEGPVGQVFNLLSPRRVAILGLGTGTMNCYRTAYNDFTFFEIDPAVIKAAKEYFTFLSDCSFEKEPRIILGDGRLELAKLKDEEFDLIILDAFSSDTIPTHLLTSDAIQNYTEHLTEEGLILFNISNRYFHLADPLTATARHVGLKSRYILDPGLSDPFSLPSSWIAISKTENILKSLEQEGWVNWVPPKTWKPWTDEHTNLLKTLRF